MSVRDDFKDYAELCFKEFGDRVGHWITLNEPRSVSKNGYATGRFAPGRCSQWLKLNCTGGDSGTEPYLTSHYQLLAHAAAANLYKTKYQTKQIVMLHGAPLTSCLDDQHDGKPLGPMAASTWLCIYPKGFLELLLFIKKEYNNPVIYITENGYDEYNDPTLSLEEALIDTYRVDYFYRHLYYLQIAIRHGVNVKGYFAWSLLDNMEWDSGYTVRFGLIFVDFKDGLKRYLKLSAHWFKNFLNKS
ncbi:unnamed protein product [Lupinus luteus]|uniref:Uncharacterized protein n=1 Tax=Lupinus luteus TaxID=3873 RepID=A0AAV1W4S5_LUPLU